MIFFFISFSISDYSYYSPGGPYEIPLKAGRYEVNCYGGKGGSSYDGEKYQKPGGNGAYVYGILNVEGTGTTFWANVGGKGSSSYNNVNAGGNNGGGSSGKDNNKKDGSGGGGGATDLRIYNNDLANRVMVAAGGSGAVKHCEGAPGGDMNGYKCVKDNVCIPTSEVDQRNGDQYGNGGTGESVPVTGGSPGSGGGGGWRGGLATGEYSYKDDTGWKGVARSGSSYISGYNGCDVTEGVKFLSGKMEVGNRDGDGYIYVRTIFECSNNCYACHNQSECTKCFDGYLLDVDKTCTETCSKGTVGVSGVCVPCKHPCSECTSTVTTCKKCAAGYSLEGSECVLHCKDGYFADSGRCSPCKETCRTCEGSADTCLSCGSGTLLYESKCHSPCPPGTVVSGTRCAKCHSYCKTCSGTVRDCDTCLPGYFLHEKMCVSSCPAKTFAKGQKCERCDEKCQTCSEAPDHCTTCNLGSKLYNGKCYTDCPPGTRQSGIMCI